VHLDLALTDLTAGADTPNIMAEQQTQEALDSLQSMLNDVVCLLPLMKLMSIAEHFCS
jgi:hypothetical protein